MGRNFSLDHYRHTLLVAIVHHSSTGRVERIIRPTPEAVPLFWRFMIEKYGICPKET